jgi:ElaB/YqjD/DUF883 family membrane-anchored ribosome-binding protein
MVTKSARLRAQTKELSSDLKEMADIAKDAAQEQLERARQNTAEWYEQGRGKVRGAACDVEQYVRDRPLKSVLIAAGAGLLFGRFWMRR